MERLLVNGRYLDRPMTGVDRVAHELVAALQNHPEFGKLCELNVMRYPPSRPLPSARDRLTSLLWEQTTLAFKSPKQFLFSPCNTGPILRRKHFVFMHDAQVFSQPRSYSKSFRAKYKIQMPLLGKSAAHIFAPSEYTEAELQRYGIAKADKISVVPNGADHILRTHPDLSVLSRHQLTRGQYFLALGSLARHKNLEMLIRATGARQNQDIPLVLAGGLDSAVFQPLKRQQMSSLKHIGRVSDGELRALYENATALVFPSKTEGFGLPPAEAMMCGCPVISSTGGAIPEVCGNATILVDPDNIAGWTEAMDTLAIQAELRAKLSHLGLLQVQKFTWGAAADRIYNTLHQHLSDNRAKAARHGVDEVA